MEHQQSCPCCTFLPDDLFLPKPDRQHETNQSTNNNEPAFETQDAAATTNTENVVLSAKDAWKILQEEKTLSVDDDNHELPIVVDTHGHAHLERGRQGAEDESAAAQQASSSIYRLEDDAAAAADSSTSLDRRRRKPCYISVTCAVQQADWEDCLAYAATNEFRMAAIGIHPWYLEDLDSSDEDDDAWLKKLEQILIEHPGVMVGEIGLCKMARFVRTYQHGKQAALALQRKVFTQQLQLAASYQRPVSIHCVNQQGVLLEIFREQQQQQQLPPAMALHSFSGTAHQVRMLLEWEKSLHLSEPLLYFGFSHAINYAMCSSEKSRRQGRNAIRAVPPDRLLAESDLHDTSDILGGTVAAIAYLAWALDEDVAVVAERTRDNAILFFQRLRGAAPK